MIDQEDILGLEIGVDQVEIVEDCQRLANKQLYGCSTHKRRS